MDNNTDTDITKQEAPNIDPPCGDNTVPTMNVLLQLRDILTPRFGHGETEAMIRLIFFHLKGWNQVDLIINENKPLSAFMVERIREIVRRLLNNEPIQYIVGQAYFYGMEFKVGEGVLVPRPETEELIDMVVKANKIQDLRVLEVGTGSGCMAIALSRNLPFPKITAIDISPKALEYAHENATSLKANINFVQADVFEYDPAPDSFDLIVSNPPYIAESEASKMEANVLDHEPHQALFVPDTDPLRFYRRIAEIGCKSLVKGGRIYFEINPLYADDLLSLMTELGYTDIDILLDIHGKKRFLSAKK